MVGFDEAPIGSGGGRESGRDADALCGQAPDHLAERGILAADPRDVASAQVVEPDCLLRDCPSS